MKFTFLKRKGFWIILGAFLIGMAFMAGGTQAVHKASSNSFCISCHDDPTFAPAFSSLEHGELDCVDCHSKGVVKDKTQGVGHLITTVKDSKAPNNYDEMKAKKFDPNKCISCHNLNSDFKDDYTKNRHSTYLRRDMNCVSCHDQKFVHGFN